MSPKSMVSVLCSVLNPDWYSLRIQGLSPLPQLQGQGRAVFYGHKEALFAYLPAKTDCSWTWAEGQTQSRYKTPCTLMTIIEFEALT